MARAGRSKHHAGIQTRLAHNLARSRRRCVFEGRRNAKEAITEKDFAITVPKSAGGNLVLTQNYTYDSLNRLSNAEELIGAANQWKQTYDYVRWGNRAVRNTPSSTYIPNPRQTPISNSAADLAILFNQTTNRITATTDYGYDNAGNLTSMPNKVQGFAADTMGFDAENHQIKFNSATQNYFYDGEGRRVKKIVGNDTTVFVYDVADQLIAEYTSGTAAAGDTSYLTTDHLGSTRLVTDSGGNVKARYDYLPFGEELGSGIGARTVGMGYSATDGTRQKFTQKERDNESGLDYFGERYYSSGQGRFTTVDPVMMSAKTTDPQSWNRFVYVLNNPLRYIDPDGLEEKTAWDQLSSQEKRILAPKLAFVANSKKVTPLELNAAGKAFNKAFTGGNAKETTAMVTAVKNFIDNAGGHSNSEVWQHITTIDGGWAGKNDSAGIRFHVDDKKGFLDVLSRNGYAVDSFNEHFNIMASHEHSARFITESSYDTAMHLVSEKGDDPRLFFTHWDPRSSAYRHGSIEYSSYGPFRDIVEKSAAGLAHDNYRSATETREQLRRQGIVPTKEP